MSTFDQNVTKFVNLLASLPDGKFLSIEEVAVQLQRATFRLHNIIATSPQVYDLVVAGKLSLYTTNGRIRGRTPNWFLRMKDEGAADRVPLVPFEAETTTAMALKNSAVLDRAVIVDQSLRDITSSLIRMGKSPKGKLVKSAARAMVANKDQSDLADAAQNYKDDLTDTQRLLAKVEKALIKAEQAKNDAQKAVLYLTRSNANYEESNAEFAEAALDLATRPVAVASPN